MRYIYIDKKNRTNVYKFRELEEKFRGDFNTYEEFSNWVEENFEMKEVYYQSPQERLRARVYATGNKWAIENYNATH